MSEEQLLRLFGDVTVAQAILWLLAAAALLFLAIKVWPVLTKFVATVNALSELPAKLRLVDEIHHEVRPNGGRSLRDTTDRIEREQIRQANILGEHTTKLDSQADALTGLQSLMESGDADLSDRVADLESTLNPKE